MAKDREGKSLRDFILLFFLLVAEPPSDRGRLHPCCDCWSEFPAAHSVAEETINHLLSDCLPAGARLFTNRVARVSKRSSFCPPGCGRLDC